MNTTMTAKNSFKEGLIMDFSPTVTKTDCMTSALNATLLTFNGNEMSLQNDMGNGRVETAFLPEGYTPVGTCEFGDIIYIISYNPMLDKAQIGCFPSPERNVSSDELSDSIVSIKAEDFQQLTQDNKIPTGELVATSVKKILYQNDMQAGDKYIVYYENLQSKHISDFGSTTHTKGSFPKFVKINIVSIEDNGKITYLDSDIKWYKNDFYINELASSSDLIKTDLDSYQSLVSSAYNTFSSKNSGKLALLFELEKIISFDCTWECRNVIEDATYKYCDLYWNFNWNSDHNDVNPSKVIIESTYNNTIDAPNLTSFDLTRHYEPENIDSYIDDPDNSEDIGYTTVCYDNTINTYKNLTIIEKIFTNNNGVITESYKTTDGSGNQSNISIPDSIINNYYKQSVTKYFGTVKILKNATGENSIYKYTIIPAMPYGKLNELSISGYIDFSKLSTTDIQLHTWKYYVQPDSISITYGLDTYTQPSETVSEVKLEFWDYQGMAACYKIPQKTSYNGTFTNTFKFNQTTTTLQHSNVQQCHSNYVVKIKNQLSNTEIDEIIKSKTYYGNNAQYWYDGASYVPRNKVENVFIGRHDYVNNEYVLSDSIQVITNDNKDDYDFYYLNDFGTIYPNEIYLVKIIIKTIKKSGEDTEIPILRWLYTLGIFNEKYFNEQDFDVLNPELSLNVFGNYRIVPENWEWQNKIVKNNNKGLSTKIDILDQNNNTDISNVKLGLELGLVNSYDEIFNLNKDSDELEKIKIQILEGKSTLVNYPEQPIVKYAKEGMRYKDVSNIHPIIDQSETVVIQDDYIDLIDNPEKYKDSTKLEIIETEYNKRQNYTVEYSSLINAKVPIINKSNAFGSEYETMKFNDTVSNKGKKRTEILGIRTAYVQNKNINNDTFIMKLSVPYLLKFFEFFNENGFVEEGDIDVLEENKSMPEYNHPTIAIYFNIENAEVGDIPSGYEPIEYKSIEYNSTLTLYCDEKYARKTHKYKGDEEIEVFCKYGDSENYRKILLNIRFITKQYIYITDADNINIPSNIYSGRPASYTTGYLYEFSNQTTKDFVVDSDYIYHLLSYEFTLLEDGTDDQYIINSKDEIFYISTLNKIKLYRKYLFPVLENKAPEKAPSIFEEADTDEDGVIDIITPAIPLPTITYDKISYLTINISGTDQYLYVNSNQVSITTNKQCLYKYTTSTGTTVFDSGLIGLSNIFISYSNNKFSTSANKLVSTPFNFELVDYNPHKGI